MKNETVRLFSKLGSAQAILVVHPTDSTGEGAHFPFLHSTLHDTLVSIIGDQGHSVVQHASQADVYVRTKFGITTGFLRLNFSIEDRKTGKMIGSKNVAINTDQLPSDWNHRGLRDIATELANKLDGELFGQKLTLVISEFSGGKTNTDQFISEFSSIMKGYVHEELLKKETFRIMEMESADENTHQLKGHFQILDGDRLVLRLQIVQPSTGHEKANVSSQFALSSVPKEVALLPPNSGTAQEYFDETITSPYVVNVWPNRQDKTYRDGDNLMVYVKSDTELYIRVYYIQSDGYIHQIYPGTRDGIGRIQADQTLCIGCSLTRMTITDNTTGQEAVKVFASLGRIDDSKVRREHFPEQNIWAIDENYRGLKMSLAIRPVAETMIRVK